MPGLRVWLLARRLSWPGCFLLPADTLSKDVRTEAGLLRYLHMLMALRDRPHLALLSTATRVRLQVRWQVVRQTAQAVLVVG
jgi:hypothetical protein